MTQTGARCTRDALPGERYCRTHLWQGRVTNARRLEFWLLIIAIMTMFFAIIQAATGVINVLPSFRTQIEEESMAENIARVVVTDIFLKEYTGEEEIYPPDLVVKHATFEFILSNLGNKAASLTSARFIEGFGPKPIPGRGGGGGESFWGPFAELMGKRRIEGFPVDISPGSSKIIVLQYEQTKQNYPLYSLEAEFISADGTKLRVEIWSYFGLSHRD